MGLLNRLVDSMTQPTDRWDFNRNRESKRGYTLTPAQQAVAVIGWAAELTGAAEQVEFLE
jgi:hypothetical protein